MPGRYFLFFLLLFSTKLHAQDITGLWKGRLYNDSTKMYYKYEIGISEEKGKLSGFSHTWFILNDTQYFGIKEVKIKRKDGKIIVEDDKLISNNYPVAPAKHIRQLNVLTLTVEDSIMKLTGPFATNRTKEWAPLTGHIELQRKNDFWNSSLVPHLAELKLENKLIFVKQEKEKQQFLAKEELRKKEELENLAFNQKKIEAVYAPNPAEEMETNEKVLSIEKNTGKKELIEKQTTTTKEIAQLKAKKIKNNTEKIQPVLPEENKEIALSETTKQEPAAIGQNPSAQIKKKETESLDAPFTQAAAQLKERALEIQQTVSFTSDSLRLSLYDNGEVDGDTVTVVMNGQIFIAKAGLSTTAINKTIYIPKEQDTLQLVMYAETLGHIPPNTGLLVIRDGKEMYEVRFSGDLKKNAAIIFKREKK
ncbi:MAG: hypothetical protein IPM10_09870 [Chitinophagaceae bacterium]|nr:hypothetical protein [Chitinophagaceae bacterium]